MLVKLAGMVGLVLFLGVTGVQFFTLRLLQRTLEQNLRDEAVLTGEALDAGFQHRGSLLSVDHVKEEMDNLVRATQNLDRITVFRDRGGRMQFFVSTEDSQQAGPTANEQRALRGDRRVMQRLENRESGPYWRVVVPLHLENRVGGAIEVRMSLQVASESAAELRRRTRWVMALSVALSVLLLAFFLHRAVERPVQGLLRAMARVQGGDLQTRAPRAGGDEFARLGAGFDSMLDRVRAGAEENRRLLSEIQDFNQQLEGRVREKTAELADRNEQLLRANRTLVDLELRLARLSRLAALGQFAATLAHEIGTPLHSISGHLELLREQRAVAPEHEHRIQVIQGQLDRVAAIVRDLLKSTRPPGTERGAVAVGAVLGELAALLEPGLEQRRIRMEIQAADGLPPVAADPHQLQQVFLNLFTNAVDAMPGGGTLTVRAALEPGPPRRVRCEVADTGQGIDPGLLPRIFEPFVTSKPHGEGTGLGLAVARDIVRRHGGTLGVESRPGRGSCFTLRLPPFEEEKSDA
ncbi:MAG: HAMP domain-containing protein [Candidatus Eisenbacteria bacterium]|nr:HAMP domain-containing protein [Candidatus Eisenbacteria bacterium]